MEHLKKAIFWQDRAKPHMTDVILMLLQKTFKKMGDFKPLPSPLQLWLAMPPPFSQDQNRVIIFCGVTSRTEFIEIIW